MNSFESGCEDYIPVIFEDPALLATHPHPNHLLYVSDSGLVYLPPRSISKSFGYRSEKLFNRRIELKVSFLDVVLEVVFN